MLKGSLKAVTSAAGALALAFLGACAVYTIDAPIVGDAAAPTARLAEPGRYCVVTIEAGAAFIDYQDCGEIVWNEPGRFYHPLSADDEGDNPEDIRLQLGRSEDGWTIFQWRDAGDDEPDAGWSALAGVIVGDVVAVVESGREADIAAARAAVPNVEAVGPGQYGAVELLVGSAQTQDPQTQDTPNTQDVQVSAQDQVPEQDQVASEDRARSVRRFIIAATASRVSGDFNEIDALGENADPDARLNIAQYWLRVDEAGPTEGRLDVTERLEPALIALRDLALSETQP